MKEIISEIALRCDDVGFNDFPFNIYERAYERATRIIARKYNIFERVETFTLSEYTDSLTDDCILNLDNYDEDILVAVNDEVYDKVSHNAELTGQYYLQRIEEELRFNYARYEKALTDTITIVYRCLPTTSFDEGEFYIPHRYEEEMINESVMYLAKLGIVKFKQEKSVKYQKLLQLSAKRDTLDPQTLEHKEWITVKTWKPY